MLGRLAILTTMTTVAIVSVSHDADACSPPAPGVSYRGVVPSEMDAPAPTNAIVEIWYSGDPGEVAREAQIRPLGGAPVGTSVSRTGNRVLVRPAAPLEPSTVYEVLDRVLVPCVGYGPCDAAAHAVVGTFTTGTGPDTTPPVFAGLARIEVLSLDVCESSGCCGPYTAARFLLHLDPGMDDSGHVRYELHRVGESTPLPGSMGYMICSREGLPGAKLPGDFMAMPGDTFFARAIDIAGNVDTNDVQLAVDFSCDPAPTDGDADAGCGCRMSHDDSAAAAPLLLLVLLLRPRRRPRV